MSGSAPRIRLAVVQASPFCNIDCRYCYLPDRASTRRMDERTLAKIFERLFASSYLGEELELLWHAGEPLTIPISFYEMAASLLADYNRNGVRIEHSLQTNATLVTQEWCEFFKAHRVHVGVSIDGPRWLHDAQRVTRRGRGTFDRAMRGVRLLQENGIRVHNIAVLTPEALDHPDEIWDFYLGRGFDSLAFNIEDRLGIHSESSIRESRDLARYQAFFRRLRELRKASGRKIGIRELDHMEARIRATSGEIDSVLTTPLASLSFDWQGNVSTFSPEMLDDRSNTHGGFNFGNVFTCGIDDILANSRFLAVHEDVQRGIAKCRDTCPYFSVCGGGEPVNKLAENGTFDSTETTHCRFVIQALCDVVLEGVEESLGLAASDDSTSPTGLSAVR